jgi:hypothetical protein
MGFLTAPLVPHKLLVLIPYSTQNSRRYFVFTPFLLTRKNWLQVNFFLLKVNFPPQMMTSMRKKRKLPSVLHPAPNLATSRILTQTTRDELAKEASDDDVYDNDDMQDDVHCSSSGSTHDNDKICNPDVDNFCDADDKVESASSPPFNHDRDDSKDDFESASSQPSDHDGDDSKEGVDVNDVHKQSAHCLTKTRLPNRTAWMTIMLMMTTLMMKSMMIAPRPVQSLGPTYSSPLA